MYIPVMRGTPSLLLQCIYPTSYFILFCWGSRYSVPKDRSDPLIPGRHLTDMIQFIMEENCVSSFVTLHTIPLSPWRYAVTSVKGWPLWLMLIISCSKTHS